MRYLIFILPLLLTGCYRPSSTGDHVQNAYEFGKVEGYKRCIADIESGKLVVIDKKVYRAEEK